MTEDDLDIGGSTTPGGDGAAATRNPLLEPANPLVTNLEQEVLDEYARLLDNLHKVHLLPPPLRHNTHD